MNLQFDFGKYKNVDLKNVFQKDKQYIIWLLSQEWYKQFHGEMYYESLNLIDNYQPKISDKIFTVYTDGACPNNGSKNARSSIGVYFPEKNNIKLKNISKPLQTDNHSNNVAELTAILEALKIIKSSEIDLPIHLYTDSSYCRSILIEWYEKWVRNNLLKNKKNLSLIKTTYDLYQTMNVTIHHVKAHTKNEDEHSYGNRMADHLATSVLK